jgi:hypothetical protein
MPILEKLFTGRDLFKGTIVSDLLYSLQHYLSLYMRKARSELTSTRS